MKTESVRMPKKLAKEIRDIQKAYRKKGVDITFTQAVVIWYTDFLKRKKGKSEDLFGELRL